MPMLKSVSVVGAVSGFLVALVAGAVDAAPAQQNVPATSSGRSGTLYSSSLTHQEPPIDHVPGRADHIGVSFPVEPGHLVGSLVIGLPLPAILPKAENDVVAAGSTGTGAQYRRSLSDPKSNPNALDIYTRNDAQNIAVVEAVRIAALTVTAAPMLPSFPGYSVVREGPLSIVNGERSTELLTVAEIGNAESAVRKAFRLTKLVATYFCERRQAKIAVWDDKATGIAFEFQAWPSPDRRGLDDKVVSKGKKDTAERICSGITIHRKGKPVPLVAPEQFDDWKPVSNAGHRLRFCLGLLFRPGQKVSR